jgi:hypothetical protein
MKIKFLLGCILLFCCFAPGLRAQDTEFWFVAPHLDSQFDRPVYFMITAGDDPAVVTMEMPAFPGFNNRVLNLAPHQSQQISFSSPLQMDTIQNNILPPNSLVGDKYNRGIRFTSTEPVSIYYQINNVSSRDMFPQRSQGAGHGILYTLPDAVPDKHRLSERLSPVSHCGHTK